MRDLPPPLLATTHRRAGVLTRSEMLRAGMSPASVRWRAAQSTALFPGVYYLGGGPHTGPCSLPFLARAWGGLLHAGGDARLAGLAAWRLHGLTADDPRVVEVAVSHARRLTDRPGWRFTRRRDGVLRTPRPVSPPRLRVEDVALDLSADATSATGRLTPVLEAVQRGVTTPAHLLARLDARARHPHRAVLHELLTDMAEGSTTHLELRYVRDVERSHGLPTASRQQRVTASGGFVDNHYVRWRAVVELDGRRGHVLDGAFRDMDRDNVHTTAGLATLRYGWRQVSDDPCRVARQVSDLLHLLGWEGTLRLCPRCPLSEDPHGSPP